VLSYSFCVIAKCIFEYAAGIDGGGVSGGADDDDDDDEIMTYYGRPEYAPGSSDEEEEEEVEFALTKQQQVLKVAADAGRDMKIEAEKDDRRLRRLQDRQQDDVDSDEDREARYVALSASVIVLCHSLISCLRLSAATFWSRSWNHAFKRKS